MQPLISIVLCTYNGEKFLAEQIESLLKQTYNEVEIIVSDDASTDHTPLILQDYIADPRIRIYFQEKNLGPVKNFEFAISKASGDYIAFSDQDDIWLPDKLLTLYTNIGDKHLVYSDSELVNNKGQKIGKKLSDLRNMYTGNDSRGFIFSNIVWGHTMLISKKLCGNALPIPPPMPHDIWLAFCATISGGIKYLDIPLTLYRQHDKTVTKTIAVKTPPRTAERLYADFKKQLTWIETLQSRERPGYLPFYNKLHRLYASKKKGHFVWPLFYFLLKHRKELYRFPRKSLLSQIIEIRKESRGVRASDY